VARRRVRFRARTRWAVVPGLVYANVNLAAFPPRITSWTFHLWRWSWNTKTRAHTIDTPGPGSVQIGPGRRGTTGDTPRFVHARPAGERDAAEQQWTAAPPPWTEPPAPRRRRRERNPQ
jgi:hypothetical protein